MTHSMLRRKRERIEQELNAVFGFDLVDYAEIDGQSGQRPGLECYDSTCGISDWKLAA
jgi:hypothetical protein